MKIKLPTNRTVWKTGVIVAFLLLSFKYFPSILYQAMNVAGIELVQPSHVLGLKIYFSDGWFPIASNESALGKALGLSPEIPGVIYYKNNWINSWGSTILVFSRIRKMSESAAISNSSNLESGHQQEWCEVIPLSPNRGRDAIKTFLIPKYGVTIGTKDVEALNAIQRIESMGEKGSCSIQSNQSMQKNQESLEPVSIDPPKNKK